MIDISTVQDIEMIQDILSQQQAVSKSELIYVGFEDDTFILSNENFDASDMEAYKPTERDW